MICKQCTREIEDGGRFCPFCGSLLEKPTENTGAAPAASEPPAGSEVRTKPAADAPQPLIQSDPISSDVTGIPARERNNTPDKIRSGVYNESANTVRNTIPNDNARPPESFTAGKIPDNNAPAEKERVFFGKGALAICLVIIGILSASTGAFAFMFFSLLNTLRG